MPATESILTLHVHSKLIVKKLNKHKLVTAMKQK